MNSVSDHSPYLCDVGIIGAGPAGLMAAETLAQSGRRITVFDASASVGRKFLLAGKGGLNLTHSEPLEQFIARYHGGGAGAADAVDSWLRAFGPQDLRDWCQGLGIDTFVGSSGRVFPVSLKAAPLLRAWLHRLRTQGVGFAMRHRWAGWDTDGQPRLLQGDQPIALPVRPRAWLLALGGGSWPQLGSNGAWIPWLRERGVQVVDLQAANCGFAVAVRQADGTLRTGWSDHLRRKFAGVALKNVAASIDESAWTQRGEMLITETGIEGNLIYAASSRLREQLNGTQPPLARLSINLCAAHPADKVLTEVTRPRGPRSWSTHLKSRLGLDGAKMALLHEVLPQDAWLDAETVGQAILALPITLTATRPISEAISTAGGITFGSLTDQLQLVALPGIFCAGEMLDWDAPTGGYLLTACMASGRMAARGVIDHLCADNKKTDQNI